MGGDLSAPRWSITSSGKVRIDSKDEVRKCLGRSRDVGDAVLMALSVPSFLTTGPLPGALPGGAGGKFEGGAIAGPRTLASRSRTSLPSLPTRATPGSLPAVMATSSTLTFTTMPRFRVIDHAAAGPPMRGLGP